MTVRNKAKRDTKVRATAALTPLKPKAPPSKIVTERLILKKLNPKMARIIFETVDSNRSHLKRFLPWVDFMNSAKDETKWIKSQQTKWKAHCQFVYGIFLGSDDTYIGNIDAHAVDWDNHKVDIGYWLAESHEGHGYMSEAVLAIEKALFALGVHRIVIQCNSKNKRSAQVPIRCGYRFEGILYQNAIENGCFRDTMIFAKLAST